MVRPRHRLAAPDRVRPRHRLPVGERALLRSNRRFRDRQPPRGLWHSWHDGDEPGIEHEHDDEHQSEHEDQDGNELETAPEPPVAAEDLIGIAKADPGVILATRILGGEVVAVRPDGEGS